MARAVVVLAGDRERAQATAWVAKAPRNTRVTFAGPKRSIPQNDRLHAMLTQLAVQRPTHHGVKMDLDRWKLVFLQAWSADLEVLPSLDGTAWFPIGQRTRDLSVAEAGELITLIQSWAAQESLDLRSTLR